jgi:hypothetical protein
MEKEKKSNKKKKRLADRAVRKLALAPPAGSYWVSRADKDSL